MVVPINGKGRSGKFNQGFFGTELAVEGQENTETINGLGERIQHVDRWFRWWGELYLGKERILYEWATVASWAWIGINFWIFAARW